jgi:transposase-like protein
LPWSTGSDRKAILPAIKAIYRAETADMALVRLEEFEAEWGKRYPAIGAAWRRAWEYVVPFFAFAPGIRKMIYTTNAVEALHRSLRKSSRRVAASPTVQEASDLLRPLRSSTPRAARSCGPAAGRLGSRRRRIVSSQLQRQSRRCADETDK